MGEPRVALVTRLPLGEPGCPRPGSPRVALVSRLPLGEPGCPRPGSLRVRPPGADSGEDRAGDLIKVQIIVLFHNRQSPQRPCTSRQRSLPLISRRLGHFIEDKVVDPRLPSSEPASRFAKAARWRLDDLSMDQGSPGSKTGSDLDGTHPLTLRRRGKHSRITLSRQSLPYFHPARGCWGSSTMPFEVFSDGHASPEASATGVGGRVCSYLAASATLVRTLKGGCTQASASAPSSRGPSAVEA